VAHLLFNRMRFLSLCGVVVLAGSGCKTDIDDLRGSAPQGGAAGSGLLPATTAGSGGNRTTLPTSSTGGLVATGGTSPFTGGIATTGGSTVTAGSFATSGGGSGGAVSTTSINFATVPKVGDVVPGATAGAPTGSVSSVTNVTSGYLSVVVSYPPQWTCPDGAAAAARSQCNSATVQAAAPNAESFAQISCAELANLRKPALTANSNAQLCSRYAQILTDKCSPSTQVACIDASGKTVASSLCNSQMYPNTWLVASGGSASIGVPVPANGATSYSTTNNQVATVDEADYVKNDGSTIYVLGTNALHVISAWPAALTHEIAKVALPGEPRRLFLSDNRLVVYLRMQSSTGSGAGMNNPSDQGCTYGYGCRFTSEGGHSLAIVYDVSTPATPTELVRYETSGGYVASRRVNQFVYTVLHDAGAPQLPGLDFTLAAGSFAELKALYDTRLDSNASLIQNTEDAYFLPWQKTTRPDGTSTTQSSCSLGWRSAAASGMSFVTISGFDLTTLGNPTRTVIGSNPGFVYASPESLYLAVDVAPEPVSVTGFVSSAYSSVKNSVIHKFGLSGTSASYRGSAGVPGHILNQFAMDEYLGKLRVASTAGWVPDPTVASYVTTFGESGSGFQQIGQIGGIAPSEDIRAVRFDEDRGYVVTFKKTDPLYIFDLSDAANPKALGELKIPGFSTYIHRLDSNHLLAIGFEADDMGSYAYFNGIQIQIFDVTDIAQPNLMWKHVIGTRGSGSEALSNHLAFNYFPPKKMLAIPMTVCEGGGTGTYGDTLTFTGLMAFDISLDAGITEHGRMPFIDPNSVTAASTCGQWWTDARSLVKRSIFMDDFIYGLSDGQLRVAELSSMTQPVATVSLTSN